MEEEFRQRSCDLLRIVLFGPESTGKTTLAIDLAKKYNTAWVPEFSRIYLQKKWDTSQTICEIKDLMPIGAGQMELENQQSIQANKLLFCDTNLLETVVYSRAYFDGYCPPDLLKHALNARYDLYFLMYIDLPWVADDLRDKPFEREEMFNEFKKALDRYNLPYVILRGPKEERLASAVKEIEKLIKEKEGEVQQ